MQTKTFGVSSDTNYQNLQIYIHFYLILFYKHFSVHMYIRVRVWLWKIVSVILNLVSSEVTTFLIFHYKMSGIIFF